MTTIDWFTVIGLLGLFLIGVAVVDDWLERPVRTTLGHYR